MADPRRTTPRGPGSRGRAVSRRTTAGTARAANPAAQVSAAAKASRARSEEARRSRLTGRAAVLVLVLAILAVSYASSLRAYLQQRGQIDDLQSQIDQQQASIAGLQSEKQQWNDPAYVQTRSRLLGYVMPGETPYVVQKDGHDLQAQSSLGDPATIGQTTPTPWWSDAWTSLQVAGHPPEKASPVPLTKIDGSGG